MGKAEGIHECLHTSFCTNNSSIPESKATFKSIISSEREQSPWNIKKAFASYVCHGASLDCIGSCGNHGPDIQFPFRIKDSASEHRGYPGFGLSRSEGNDTDA
ncbi:unnamed protein product [Dovyalis caffra]|uniref:Uncharacterized protein n=1 Tax=Dovyalis caffra TaxID=77055 RepID=A0AAV1REE0_9ROSI|nr:unnamed protein product [Dovyalis caffra]